VNRAMRDSASQSANAAAPKASRIRRLIRRVVLFLLVLAVGTGAVYVALLDRMVTTKVKHEALLPTPSAGESVPPEIPSAKDAQDILLIGSDSDGSIANGRSDVIVLMHISGDRQKVYLVHFPRDIYVDVPGYGMDKINAAYAYGGPQLLVRTLQNLVDVSVDHMVVVGFAGFKAMTDAVGGVDVYAEEASNEFGPIHVGVNHLDGEAALWFVRERYQLSQGDLSRGRRQQAFVKALMLKVLSKETLTNPLRFAELVDAATRSVIVDNAFSVADIYSQALAMRDLRSDDIVFITAPISGFGTTPKGASIDIVDDVKMAQLSAALRSDDMSGISIGQQIP
jgi:LCP family protein required for cell wall assembly